MLYFVMDSFPQFSRLSLVSQVDSFQSEFEDFQRDVHLLILGTLHAAKTYLSSELAADVTKIESALEKATGGHREHLADRHAELHMYCSDQERFVRNIAVVALASRLTPTPDGKICRDFQSSKERAVWRER